MKRKQKMRWGVIFGRYAVAQHDEALSSPSDYRVSRDFRVIAQASVSTLLTNLSSFKPRNININSFKQNIVGISEPPFNLTNLNRPALRKLTAHLMF